MLSRMGSDENALGGEARHFTTEPWVVFDLVGVLAEPAWRDLATLEESRWGAFKRGRLPENEFWAPRYAQAYRHMLAFRPDRLAIVRRSKARGLRICVAANFSRDWLDHLLAKTHQESLFDAEVVSTEIGVAKADGAFWSRLLERVPRGSVYVDDQRVHCLSAERAGLRSIWAHPACDLEGEIEALREAMGSQSTRTVSSSRCRSSPWSR